MLRILASSLAVGVLVLYITACGGGGDDVPTSTPSTSSAPTSTPTTSAAPTSTPSTSAASGGGVVEVPTSTPTTSAASGGSVTSPDGSLTLSIPSGALPKGTAVDSISVLPLSSEELERWGEGTVLAGYDLKPDGLEFTEPVSVTLRLPLPSTGISFQILLVSDDTGNETQGIEEVRVLGVESNEETGELVVSAELSHFTQMVVSLGFFDLSLEAPDNVMVGETFTAVAKMELTFRSRVREYEFEGENFVSTKTPTGNWQLGGNFKASPNLSPRAVFDRPPSTSLSTRVFTVRQVFKCEMRGAFTISYAANLVAEEHSVIRRSDESVILEVTRDTLFTTNYFVDVVGFCIGRAPIPSPSPVTAVTAIDDAINDALNCVTGESSTSPMPPSMDIIRVSVELDAAIEEYIFEIEFAGEFTEEFWGGIEIYSPRLDLVPNDPNWFFNNTGNLSINFHMIPPVILNFDGIFGVEGGEWRELVPDSEGFYIITSVIQTSGVQGDRIQITLPAVPSQAGEDIFWLITTTNFNVCDEAGLGAENLPILDLDLDWDLVDGIIGRSDF